MTASELLATLTADGFAISVQCGQLIVSPASGLFSHVRDLIRFHKAALIELVDPDPRVTCSACQHYRPRRCANWRAALLSGADISTEFAGTRQHCPAYRGRDSERANHAPGG